MYFSQIQAIYFSSGDVLMILCNKNMSLFHLQPGSYKDMLVKWENELKYAQTGRGTNMASSRNVIFPISVLSWGIISPPHYLTMPSFPTT
jgi:hypothetical protein